jgi:membrane protein
MKLFSLPGVSSRGIYGTSWGQFFRDLWRGFNETQLLNGAAALGFYFLLALFPSMLFLLSLLAFLPIPNLNGQIMGLLQGFLPSEAYALFSETVREITSEEKSGILSLSAVLTLWAASSGMHAAIQHLNLNYGVAEARPYWKARGIAVLLTIGFGLLTISGLLLVLLGGVLHRWLTETLGLAEPLAFFFSGVRWCLIGLALLTGFALTYYFGPNIKQKFQLVTLGSLVAATLLVAASLGFKFYAENFGEYNATYGSIGAVIVLMLWLQILGLVLLFGSEINALMEYYRPERKLKGPKQEQATLIRNEPEGKKYAV